MPTTSDDVNGARRQVGSLKPSEALYSASGRLRYFLQKTASQFADCRDSPLWLSLQSVEAEFETSKSVIPDRAGYKSAT